MTRFDLPLDQLRLHRSEVQAPCDMRRASELVDTEPYARISRHLRTHPPAAHRGRQLLFLRDQVRR